MKRKKRRPNAEACVEDCGSRKQQQQQEKTIEDWNVEERIHVLSLCDDLEGFLAPSTPEVHRVCIPAAGERGEFLRRGVFHNGCGGECVKLNPKPCRGRSCGSRTCVDLILSQDALKEPTQAFVEGFEKLLEKKFGIMALRIRHGLDAWSLGSHMVNPFEILSFVAATSVMNRAHFKMWELIQTFDLVPSVTTNSRFLSAHLCEGPGGFIEAVLEYRAQSSISADDSKELCQRGSGGLQRADSSSMVNEADTNCSSNSSSSSHRRSGSDVANRIAIPKSYCAVTSTKDRLNRVSGIAPCEDNPKAEDAIHLSTMVNGRELDGQASRAGTMRPTGIGKCNQNPILNSPWKDLSTSYSIAPVQKVSTVEGELDEADLPTGVDVVDGDRDVISQSPRARRRRMDGANPHCSLPVTEPNLKRSKQYHDMWFGLTLATTQQCGTGGSAPKMEMTRLNEKVAGNSEGHVHYGVDGSGDITNPSNLCAFVEHTLGRSEGQRMDLITADGAFDVSEDFSSQEHSHLHLVFCEVLCALRLQAEGGSFVLKLFDCYTVSTLSILFILSSLYRNVEIVRLRTTRICNSERYVVAKGFFALSPQLEEVLVRLNSEWNKAAMKGEKVGVLLPGGFPEQLLQAVMESNAAISTVQIDGINRALQLADAIGERLPPPDSFGRRKGSVSMLRRKLQTQERMQRNAIALCHELHIPCRSQFFPQR